MVRTVLLWSAVALGGWSAAWASPPLALATDTFVLEVTADGRLARLVDRRTGRDRKARPGGTLFTLRKQGRDYGPTAVSLRRTLWGGRRLRVEFARAGVTARLRVRRGRAFLALELLSLDPPDGVEAMTLCRLGVDVRETVAWSPNAAYDESFAVAVMALAANVQARPAQLSRRATSPCVTQRLTRQARGARQGPACLRYEATNPGDKPGWSYCGRALPRALDLSRHRTLALWLHGDGKGQLFKVQLRDDHGGWRDDYVKVDFTGWRYLELTTPQADKLDYARVAHANLYYNGLPPSTSVCCLADDLRAIPAPRGKPEHRPGDVALATFDEAHGSYASSPTTVLPATALARYGPLVGSGAAIVAAPRAEFTRAIAEMERACGLPSPRLGGAWGKESPDVRRSYLFITRFGEADTDEVIAAAHRAGFAYVLIGQGSWSKSTGHFPINTTNFPRGRRSLRSVIRRFHRAGLKAGLHFLAAGISARDAYVTPVPDPRLVKDASATLAKAVDAKADRIDLAEPPAGFPAEDGGYRGKGAVVQIGDELILYAERSLDPPALLRCRRGHLKTRAAAHPAGEAAHHLHRSYGYFLHDADAGLTDEVAERLTRIANYADADMLYFDGSERLQGEHWHYNAKIQMAYARRLRRRDVLLQGSSYSHLSWHALSRCASADGHGDLKGYLDQRLPHFENYKKNLMPLDLGWYYIYDLGLALDQFEYVLGKSLGFGCSISLQTNPVMLRTYPRMAEILDLVAAYEQARLARAFPDEVLARLRQPGVEFRLRGHTLTRAVYEPERLLTKPETWTVANDGPEGPCHLAGELLLGHIAGPGDEYSDPQAVRLEDFESLAPYARRATRQGVVLRAELVAEGARTGTRCLRYSATNASAAPHGWSYMGSTREPPLDLSAARGIGYWLKGAGTGEANRAAFKIQLLDTDHQPQDYYTRTDFDGWRYIELVRPEKGRMDWSRVARVNFYFNSLPAKTTLTVLVDGVRAIPRLHEAAVRRPRLRVGTRTVALAQELAPGQVVVLEPESVIVRGAGGAVVARRRLEGGPLALSRGPTPIAFACDGPLTHAVRIRLARLYPGERYTATNPRR